MIQTPYKLDLILKTNNNTDENINFVDTNLDEKDNKDKYYNKMKSIILNMSTSDVYSLNASNDSGFNLKIPLVNKNRLDKNNYYENVLSDGIVGPIYLDEKSELKKYFGNEIDVMVLKLVDCFNCTLEEFIKKWDDDHKYYSNLIPDIYFYGNIVNTSGDLLSYYYITKKYYDYKDIIKQNDFNFAVNFLKKILVLFDTLLSRSYIYRNLTMFGLGFEKVIKSKLNNKYDFEIVILDYNNFSLLSLRDNFFKQFDDVRCGSKKCLGYLTPYYVIDDYYNLNKNWLSRLDKFYSLGLVEIILILFYNHDEYLTKIYDFIIGPSFLESQLQYYHLHKRFRSEKNIHNLILAVNKLNFRYCNINPIFESGLESVIINLLETDYDKIYYPNHILNIIKKIEESNNEFEIKYDTFEEIYNPKNDNYLNVDYNVKKKILSEDSYEINELKLNSNINENIHNLEIITNIKDKGDEKKEILKVNNSSDYFNLYKKYKLKYLALKEKKFGNY